MNPHHMLNEGVMNEQLSLKLLWEVPYKYSLSLGVESLRGRKSHCMLYICIT